MPVTIQVNGSPIVFEEAPSIRDLIHRIEIHSPAIAVAVNSEIIPRASFGDVKLRDQDRVDIIRPVGGG